MQGTHLAFEFEFSKTVTVSSDCFLLPLLVEFILNSLAAFEFALPYWLVNILEFLRNFRKAKWLSTGFWAL